MRDENNKSSATSTHPWPTANEVVARFRRRLLIFGVHHLGKHDDAEDLAQETLARVVASMQKGALQDPEALPAFVYQTARNVLKERFRKKGREARALARYKYEAGNEYQADGFAALITAERSAQVQRALQTLSTDDRNLLQHLFGQGLDAGEVADRIGTSAATVRVRKHRALARLSVALGEHLAVVASENLQVETNGGERQPELRGSIGN